MSATPITPKTPKPESLVVTEREGYFSAQWRWFQPQDLFLTFFTFIWFSFLIGWYTSITSMGVYELGFFGLIFYVFPLLHVGAGIFIGQKALRGLLNKTRVELHMQAPSGGPFRSTRSGTLRITHGPIPGERDLEVPLAEIAQLYCCEERKGGSKNAIFYNYQLVSLSNQDEMKVLLKNLPKPEIARYLEQKLESLLEIQDAPVRGEMNK